VKRYDLVQVNACYTTDHEMELSEDGEWVRFEDVVASVPAAPPAPTAERIETMVVVTCGQRGFKAILPATDYNRVLAMLSGLAAPLAPTAERKWIASGMTSYTADGEVTGYVNPPAAPPERVSEGKEAFDWRKAQDKYNETVRHVVNELGLAELLAALDALIIDANRLCDRQLGGSYEDDCRRSIEAAKLARRAARPAVEPREEPR
jgi:hypothetical protein